MGLPAGLSALAEYSALAEPRVPVVALDQAKATRMLTARGIQELPAAEKPIERWGFGPTSRARSDGPAVDRLSLHLSLRKDADERGPSALDKMIRGIKW